MSTGAQRWSDAALAAALFAIDPMGTAGVCVRSGAGPLRQQWLDDLRRLLPPRTSLRKLPMGISEGRLLGGVDLAATLRAGRPVVERGLLAEIDGGVLLVAMAERLSPSMAAHLNAVLDSRALTVERDGLSLRLPTSFGVVALDEGVDDERAPASLCDRLAFLVDLGGLTRADLAAAGHEAGEVAAARDRLSHVTVPPDALEVLCSVAASLGVASLRASLLAVRVARAAAALHDGHTVRSADVEIAARLVLAPRATTLPAPQGAEVDQPPEREPADADDVGHEGRPLDEVVLEAAKAAIPPDLLKHLHEAGGPRQSSSAGRRGMAKAGPLRGRPVGTRRGELRSGVRLNVLETLRAAAPWQPLRRRSLERDVGRQRAVLIHKQDFRITRFKQNSATSTIFVVDASGSSALQRLAEVKGAVEMLLADCYVRRDEVALIAFRGRTAELILPPTRSLTRAKRSLAALPGGGGTPLSAAIVSATTLALAVRNKGHSPTIIVMTDGRANVSRDGSAGRIAAEAEAHEAARQLGEAKIPAVLIDTSPRPQPQAERIATVMRARYVALPYADAERLSRAVRTTTR